MWRTPMTFVMLCGLILISLVPAVSNSRSVPAAIPANIPTVSTADLARAGVFYVGGQYVGAPGKEVMHGAMAVEIMVPKHIRHMEPIVFLHGVGQTATVWLQTPDGRPGWAYFFLKRGYVIYLLDLPGRGRSAYVPDVDGPLGIRSASQLSGLWTAVEQLGGWPQASRYSQWPGQGSAKGKMGDPVFDDFARSQVQFPSTGIEQTVVDAGTALLDRIATPVILLTHSQGGEFGWSLADARPHGVAAIVAIEPAGPPLRAVELGKTTYSERPNLRWGLTNLPLHYSPPIADPSELQVDLETQAASGRLPCYLQTQPVHRLENLAHIPVALVSGEAGYHRVFDACTAKWLQQAGVPTDYIELESRGLHGNGHVMMLEKNSDEIASMLADWLQSKGH
jgi:pimeloyl-ACP methyl ester carboxylesterase